MHAQVLRFLCALVSDSNRVTYECPLSVVNSKQQKSDEGGRVQNGRSGLKASRLETRYLARDLAELSAVGRVKVNGPHGKRAVQDNEN